MFLSADENAAIEKTVELVRGFAANDSTFAISTPILRQLIQEARSMPGTWISWGGLTFVHHVDDSPNSNEWAETKVFLNIAEFLNYSDGVKQQFVFQHADENDVSVPEDWM